MRMSFLVNTSPFAGREGKFVTSRNLRDRLFRELERNLAMRVEAGESADEFIVCGRGTLHLGILIENMRREGCAAKPSLHSFRPRLPLPTQTHGADLVLLPPVHFGGR